MAFGQGAACSQCSVIRRFLHQAGVGEHCRAARHAAQHAAVPGLAPQPLKRRGIAKPDGVAAGDDEGEVELAGRFADLLHREPRRRTSCSPAGRLSGPPAK